MSTIRELLNDPSKWTQNQMARDAEKKPTYHSGPKAVCWCLIGAAVKVYGAEKAGAEIIPMLQKHLNIPVVVAWNDNPKRTYDEVIKVVTELNL